MGVVLGLSTGLGLALIWAAVAMPPRAARTATRTGRLRALLVRAGLGQVAPSGFVTLCVVSALAVGLLIQVLSRTLPVAIVFATMAGWLPVILVSSRARNRQREFAQVWPEAVDNLASAVRAGLSLPEAVAALGQRGPEPLRPAFTQFALDYQLTGRFSESLDRLKERLADPVGDRVIEGLRVAREVGGGELGRLLRNLSGYLRDEAHTRSEMESRQTWTVAGARMAVAAPWLVLFLLCFQPEVIGRYNSAGGVLVLAGGAGCCVVAYRLMMRIGRLPTEQRILT
ncbi:type II secretion system F family protein [Nocardioides limicola]|uniref:type II secretion system F family protein n=1 Tax=Nocardioides limicola TaxID=2803368 RepID=UPI00193AE337|nr:type II secretion system F family protein [Nocardioides sp. DJM-14]